MEIRKDLNMALEQEVLEGPHTKGVKKFSPKKNESDEAEAKRLNMSFCATRSRLISIARPPPTTSDPPPIGAAQTPCQ